MTFLQLSIHVHKVLSKSLKKSDSVVILRIIVGRSVAMLKKIILCIYRYVFKNHLLLPIKPKKFDYFSKSFFVKMAFISQLLPYQISAQEWLLHKESSGAILAYDMGLGKNVIALSLLCNYPKKTLIILRIRY